MLTKAEKADRKEKHGEFLQGYALGFYSCMDALREYAKRQPPDWWNEAFISAIDAMEKSLKGSDFEKLLGDHTLPELRATLAESILASRSGKTQ